MRQLDFKRWVTLRIAFLLAEQLQESNVPVVGIYHYRGEMQSAGLSVKGTAVAERRDEVFIQLYGGKFRIKVVRPVRPFASTLTRNSRASDFALKIHRADISFVEGDRDWNQ